MDVQRQYVCGEEPRSLGITQQKPKHPQYAGITKRLESFATWPYPVSADELAECGFVYTGEEDGVRCFSCGIEIKRWEPSDDPWVEHVKWSLECHHVLLNKGQSFIDRVSCAQTVIHLSSAAAQSCVQMGYTEERVQRAISTFISVNGHSNFTDRDLCELFEEETKSQAACLNVEDTSSSSEVRLTSSASGDSKDEDDHHGDMCWCLLCKVELKGVAPLDDPWEDHFKWYPNCPHALRNKGQDVIDRVRRAHTIIVLSSAAAQSCLQMDYTEKSVKRAIAIFICLNGHSNFTGQDLCELMEKEESTSQATCMNVEDSSSSSAVQLKVSASGDSKDDDAHHETVGVVCEKKGRLMDNQKCEFCLKTAEKIMYLPCGHMKTCHQSSSDSPKSTPAKSMIKDHTPDFKGGV